MVPVPLVAFGICAARVAVAGVQDTEVLVVFVAIVPDAVPNAQVKVCVKEELARLMAIVPAVPIVKSDTEIDDARGMVVRAAVPVPDTLPRAVPENVMPLKLYENEKLADLLPSALCETVVEPLASVTVAPLLTPQDTDPLYSAPLNVTVQARAVEVEMRPELSAMSFKLHATTVVLFATDWEDSAQEKRSVSWDVTVLSTYPDAPMLNHLPL
jgi:hypothetical protein